MTPLTEAEIRRSFVNCSQGAVETLTTEERIERLQTNLDTFVRRVVGGADLPGPRNG